MAMTFFASGNVCDGQATQQRRPTVLASQTNGIECWLTMSDHSVLLTKQSAPITFESAGNQDPDITIDTTQKFQSIDGYGFALTGGSAALIHRMAGARESGLLHELFGNGPGDIGISYLRLSIGASDLNSFVFSYDDMPEGTTDINLDRFSLGNDTVDVIPVLKEILAVNPRVKLMATPWSAPVWMKDNGSSVGGTLQARYYSVYARYFVKYILAMKAKGIVIEAVTPQNEPLNPGNNPSLTMSPQEQIDFVKNDLGPAFQAAGIATKIIIYDHNCDDPAYPMTVLSDPGVNPYIFGSAFHLYAGDISALSRVHAAFPGKALYFTEQYTSSGGNFGADLRWHIKNVIIGSMRNWSRSAIEWNLANDAAWNPHTKGGCDQCQGALTIGDSVTRNVSYYIVAHASKFVPQGSVRIASNISGALENVAFQTPSGKKVLIVENDGAVDQKFNIYFYGKRAAMTMQAGAVGTFVWQ